MRGGTHALLLALALPNEGIAPGPRAVSSVAMTSLLKSPPETSATAQMLMTHQAQRDRHASYEGSSARCSTAWHREFWRVRS
jgi:hypothetical protein